MSLDLWSERNKSLNALCAAIQHGTHGLIHNLSLDLTDDDCVVVRGNSRSYHGVQLAIHKARQFGDKHRLFDETQLLLSVNGTPLQLVMNHPANDDVREFVSTQDATRRLQLTIAPAA